MGKGEFVFKNFDGIEFHDGDKIRWIKTDYKGKDMF